MGEPGPRGATRIVALACFIFGMAWLAIAAPFFLRQWEVQRHWPRANATLRLASVIEDSTPGGKLYKTHLEFNVETPSGAHPATVEGYRISSDRSKVEAAAARWNSGAQYVVRVNPHDPAEIRLDVDSPFRHFFIPSLFGSIGALFFAISAAIIFMARR